MRIRFETLSERTNTIIALEKLREQLIDQKQHTTAAHLHNAILCTRQTDIEEDDKCES